jgi:hypothetical protein
MTAVPSSFKFVQEVPLRLYNGDKVYHVATQTAVVVSKVRATKDHGLRVWLEGDSPSSPGWPLEAFSVTSPQQQHHRQRDLLGVRVYDPRTKCFGTVVRAAAENELIKVRYDADRPDPWYGPQILADNTTRVFVRWSHYREVEEVPDVTGSA